MIPVTQTKVVVRNSKNEIVQHGNCWAAAIASILELPITEVPNFEVWFDTKLQYLWSDLTDCFLIMNGYICEYDNRFKVFHKTREQWNTEQDEQWFCAFTDYGDYDDLWKQLHNEFYLISGMTVRGFSHVIICKAGKMVHDPHPTKEGILELTNFQYIRKLTSKEIDISKNYVNNRTISIPTI